MAAQPSGVSTTPLSFVLDKIGNNTLVMKDIELRKLTPGVYSCIMVVAIIMK